MHFRDFKVNIFPVNMNILEHASTELFYTFPGPAS